MKKEKILPVLIGLIIISPFVAPFFIKILSVQCKTQYGDCSESLNFNLQTAKNRNLFTAKAKAQKVLRSDYFISDFSIHFKLPNTLKIETVVRKPIYSITKKDSGNYIFADRDGTVLTTGSESSLPTLIVEHDLTSVGDKVSDEDLFSLYLISGISNMYQKNIGEVSNNSLLVELEGPINVIFPLGVGDKDLLLGSLRLIYSRIREENLNNYREIDLRFRNPVLR